MPSAAATTIHTPDGQDVEYPARLLTVAQLEVEHPGLKGRVRSLIHRADLNDPDHAGLRDAVIRLGRSIYIDEPLFLAGLRGLRGVPPASSRNPAGRGGSSGSAK